MKSSTGKGPRATANDSAGNPRPSVAKPTVAPPSLKKTKGK